MSVAVPRQYLKPADWAEAPCAVPDELKKNHRLWRVESPGGKSLFTGYFEPELRGSLTRQGPFQHALYAPPADLICMPNTAEVGGFGRMENGKITPHFSRAEIENGALEGKNLELLYVDDPVDLFFLQVQGSGQIHLPDGGKRRVSFAAKNGQAYTSIGAVLKREEHLNPATMGDIKNWLRAYPERRAEILNRNASFIFFKFLEGPGPVGASGEVLQPERSLAVDDTLWPYGLEVIVETRDPLENKPLVRLMRTADTGSAIRGVVRGDIFFGCGAEAGRRAGAMAHEGRLWIILPVSN
ncbi:MAG: MltA domain-containing protein [Proteobacteria bacterium]|nr:MltA domain-containing protein [Pseudomonadota bacterium]